MVGRLQEQTHDDGSWEVDGRRGAVLEERVNVRREANSRRRVVRPAWRNGKPVEAVVAGDRNHMRIDSKAEPERGEGAISAEARREPHFPISVEAEKFQPAQQGHRRQRKNGRRPDRLQLRESEEPRRRKPYRPGARQASQGRIRCERVMSVVERQRPVRFESVSGETLRAASESPEVRETEHESQGKSEQTPEIAVPMRLRRRVGEGFTAVDGPGNHERAMIRIRATILILGAILVGALPLQAQEFNCTVQIDTKALSGSDFSHLGQLKDQVEEYLNGRAWTNDTFQPEERIQCSVTITFLSANTQGIDRFTARMTLGISRPIYGSPNLSEVFRMIDENWQFAFDRNQSLFYDPERYDPLSSTLDYWAYVMLGYDYDTFSELGGTPYFEAARKVRDIANTAGGLGWNAISDDRSRAAIVRDMLDPRMADFRRGLYTYHFDGLDLFLSDPVKARANTLDMLEKTQVVREDLPTSLVLDLFFTTKKDELTSFFVDSNVSSEAYGRLLAIDPSNASTYDRLLQ